MALLLREADVRALFPMSEAVRLVRRVFEESHRGRAVNQPRRRIKQQGCVFSSMSAGVEADNAVGLKAYTAGRQGTAFMVALWDSESGRLLALIEADWLGRIRTGAASGVATDALARPGARSVGIIGSGSQARTQLEAVAAVRSIARVSVFSRSRERRDHFTAEMRELLGCDVLAVESPRAAVEEAEIVITITTSGTPTVLGDWLAVGTHVNAAGSNQPDRREVDTNVVRKSSVVAVDSVEQAKVEAGDLLIPVEEGALSWEDVTEIGGVLAGDRHGRTGDADITLFKSLGVAIEDVTAARYLYERAVAEGRGEQSSFGER